MLTLILAFLAGAIVESVCVLWVSAIERNRVALAVLLSMTWAASSVLVIGEAIRDRLAMLAFVLGYSAGTFVAMRVRQKFG